MDTTTAATIANRVGNVIPSFIALSPLQIVRFDRLSGPKFPALTVRRNPLSTDHSKGEAMPAAKTSRKRTSTRSTNNERPLTPDQYLALNNKPAAKKCRMNWLKRRPLGASRSIHQVKASILEK